jgi:hypothetical protein
VKLAAALSLRGDLRSAASAGFQGDVAALEVPGEGDAEVLRGQAFRATLGQVVFDANVGRGFDRWGPRPACWPKVVLAVHLIGGVHGQPAAGTCAGRKRAQLLLPVRGAWAMLIRVWCTYEIGFVISCPRRHPG